MPIKNLTLYITVATTNHHLVCQDMHGTLWQWDQKDLALCTYCLRTIFFFVGNELLHVIDVSVPEKAKVIFYTTLKGGELTDIETCGDFVAVAYDNMINPLDGQVVIYSGYDFGSNKMERIHTIKGKATSVPNVLSRF